MGFCQGMPWDPYYKKLHVPNGVDLRKNNRFKWLSNSFNRTTINIKFGFKIIQPNGSSVIETLSNETIYYKHNKASSCFSQSPPEYKLKEVLLEYISETKKRNKLKYDEIWSSWAIDPRKTMIRISYISENAQSVINKYNNFEQIPIVLQKIWSYDIDILLYAVSLKLYFEVKETVNPGDAFTGFRRQLTQSSISTGLSKDIILQTKLFDNSSNTKNSSRHSRIKSSLSGIKNIKSKPKKKQNKSKSRRDKSKNKKNMSKKKNKSAKSKKRAKSSKKIKGKSVKKDKNINH